MDAKTHLEMDIEDPTRTPPNPSPNTQPLSVSQRPQFRKQGQTREAPTSAFSQRPCSLHPINGQLPSTTPKLDTSMTHKESSTKSKLLQHHLGVHHPTKAPPGPSSTGSALHGQCVTWVALPVDAQAWK
ncbi:hypothetical protein Q3G72_024910 [Acer saccharum]|nr:hypothetical protein Q3G72_024910 [Acer saccharum]